MAALNIITTGADDASFTTTVCRPNSTPSFTHATSLTFKTLLVIAIALAPLASIGSARADMATLSAFGITHRLGDANLTRPATETSTDRGTSLFNDVKALKHYFVPSHGAHTQLRTLNETLQFSIAPVLSARSAQLESPTKLMTGDPPQQTSACKLSNQSVPNGQSVKAYQSAHVPYGSLCKSQIRSCLNGEMSGSYTFASCQINVPSHSIYFGYINNGGFSGDKADYLPELVGTNNVAMIQDGNDLVDKIKEAKEDGMYVIVNVPNEFFRFANGTISLAPDYRMRWNALAAKIRPYVDDGTIVGFFPLDEPYWEASNFNASNVDNTKDKIRNAIESANSAIKATFPQIITMVIFSAYEVERISDGSLHIPAGYDWIGFDCYGAFRTGCDGHSIPWFFNVLKSKITATQHLILVPGAFVSGSNAETGQNALIATIDQYIKLAKDASIIGIFPFAYQPYPGAPPTTYFAKDLPLVAKRYKSIFLSY
jgi:hypothetical protein